MISHTRRVRQVFGVIALGLVAMLATSIIGCETALFDDEIYPWIETREECYEEETWQCLDDEAQLCRNGFWNPWYNCAWNGGTCEVNEDASMGGCIDPPEEELACEINPVNLWEWATDTSTVDTDTEDSDTGPWNIVTVTWIDQTCSICINIPEDPADFEDDSEAGDTDTTTPNMPGGATNGVLGCCSVADGNAYWGEDVVVLQSCANGCCAFIDYTSTLDSPVPVRHGCCD